MVLTRRAREVALTQHIGVFADRSGRRPQSCARPMTACVRSPPGLAPLEPRSRTRWPISALALTPSAGARNFSRFRHQSTRHHASAGSNCRGNPRPARSTGSPGRPIRLWIGPNPRSRLRIQCHFRPTSRRWAACRARGQDPTRPSGRSISADEREIRSLPAGDLCCTAAMTSTGCCNIQAKHGRQWHDIAMHRWPSVGNWRYLADYAPVPLAFTRSEWSTNPRQRHVRRIPVPLPDGRYVFTTRHYASAREDHYGLPADDDASVVELRKVMVGPPLKGARKTSIPSDR